ncbi:universal stress protein [Roseiconus lacunae]|uniref:Universal stress protein n=1 Tax=Roseiconus lacunae TaxID=2605694 RepID=A0ABT7PN96_9BACT|nr:universal stress protein [Roseiconus lacunae]MCD0463329.1 universal stress protein [Roseiconus lacunae]MDM4017957.1 universal stress protein [Roseiconus lacunae]WRQ52469.1 universal stress protein [Stieleria sp. HD01]
MNNVVLAIDGSEPSLEAAQFFAHLPHNDSLFMTVATVVQRPYIHSSYAVGELLEKAFERDQEFAKEKFQEVEEIFDGANVTLDHVAKDGPVGETIVEIAEKRKADLVVVGAKGHSGIARLLLGSVSDHVATHAPCSTLIVRPTELLNHARPIRVCLAFEVCQSAIAALEEISQIPWKTGTEFHLLTVQTFLSDFIGERIADEGLDLTEHAEEGLKEAKERLREVAPNAQTHVLRTDHIGEGIVSFVEDNGIDLLVIGETPRSAVNRFLLGSTSRYVLRHAPCSIWVTRNKTPDAS